MSQPVKPALDAVLTILTILAELAVDPKHADEMAAEKIRLGQIVSRANLVFNLVDAGKVH